MGHDGRAFAGATFINNRPREIDYGWRAAPRDGGGGQGDHQDVLPSAPGHPIWDGCSTGGRRAVEAQRFPDDFDGIVAGDLFMNAIEIAVEQVWSSAIFFYDVNGDNVGFDNNITQANIDSP